jgi:hypothetical protein
VLAGCSRPPCCCDFPSNAVSNGVSVHTPLLGGRRLTQAVGPAGRRARPQLMLVAPADHGPPSRSETRRITPRPVAGASTALSRALKRARCSKLLLPNAAARATRRWQFHRQGALHRGAGPWPVPFARTSSVAREPREGDCRVPPVFLDPPSRPNPRCSRRAYSLRFSLPAAVRAPSRLGAPSPRPRLSFSVGLAAFSVCCSSSAPERSRLRAALRSHRARHQPRAPSALIGPPWLSCQPPCVLHSRRVRSAVARLGASPLRARLGTVHSCRARP